MRHHRNAWLEALTPAEFAGLDPWLFINDEESRKQWLAEVRSKLRISMSDEEIHSILSIDLYHCISRAIRKNTKVDADARGQLLIGSALAYIRRKGIAKVFDEIPGAKHVSLCDYQALGVRRSHALQDEYGESTSSYAETIEQAPVFLSEGVVLPDTDMQSQHRLIELIRCQLTTREYQLLRLLVIDGHSPANICDILDLQAKQVGKIRRNLKLKLADLAMHAGISPELVAGYVGSTAE
jgi:hypothetical protein